MWSPPWSAHHHELLVNQERRDSGDAQLHGLGFIGANLHCEAFARHSDETSSIPTSSASDVSVAWSLTSRPSLKYARNRRSLITAALALAGGEGNHAMRVKGVRGPSILHRPRKTEGARLALESVIQCPGSLDGHRVFLSQEFGQREVVIARRG